MPRQKKASTAQPLLLSVADVAVQLGVCRNTVYKLMRRKSLPSVMLGGVRRIHPSSLHDWLKQCEQETA